MWKHACSRRLILSLNRQRSTIAATCGTNNCKDLPPLSLLPTLSAAINETAGRRLKYDWICCALSVSSIQRFNNARLLPSTVLPPHPSPLTPSLLPGKNAIKSGIIACWWVGRNKTKDRWAEQRRKYDTASAPGAGPLYRVASPVAAKSPPLLSRSDSSLYCWNLTAQIQRNKCYYY